MSRKNQKVQRQKKKGLFMILLVSILILAVSALAGYTWFEMKKLKREMAPGAHQAATHPAVPVIPRYLPLETFTVSLRPITGEEDRIVYIGLTLRVKDDNSLTLLKKYLPEVRSRLLMMISNQTADALSTDKGKADLVEKIKTEVGKKLSPDESAVITDVLFNAFILR